MTDAYIPNDNDIVRSIDPMDKGFTFRVLHTSAIGVCQCRVIQDDLEGDIVYRHYSLLDKVEK